MRANSNCFMNHIPKNIYQILTIKSFSLYTKSFWIGFKKRIVYLFLYIEYISN